MTDKAGVTTSMNSGLRSVLRLTSTMMPSRSRILFGSSSSSRAASAMPTNVVVLDFIDLQINEHEAAQDAVIENEVDAVVGVVERDAVLPADEGEALAQFQQKRLKMVAETGFEIGLGNGVRLGYFQELEDEGIAQQIGGLRDDLALLGELEDGLPVFSRSETQKEGRFFLALQFSHSPLLAHGLLLVEAAFQRIVELQKLDPVRPAQKVRRCRTFGVREVELLILMTLLRRSPCRGAA